MKNKYRIETTQKSIELWEWLATTGFSSKELNWELSDAVEKKLNLFYSKWRWAKTKSGRKKWAGEIARLFKDIRADETPATRSR